MKDSDLYDMGNTWGGPVITQLLPWEFPGRGTKGQSQYIAWACKGKYGRGDSCIEKAFWESWRHALGVLRGILISTHVRKLPEAGRATGHLGVLEGTYSLLTRWPEECPSPQFGWNIWLFTGHWHGVCCSVPTWHILEAGQNLWDPVQNGNARPLVQNH